MKPKASSKFFNVRDFINLFDSSTSSESTSGKPPKTPSTVVSTVYLILKFKIFNKHPSIHLF